MDVQEVRDLLGKEYAAVSDETLEQLLELINCVCTYIITTHKEQPPLSQHESQ